MKILQEIRAPQESVNDLSVEVIEMTFSDGDYVKKGEELIKLENSKASFSILAENDGYIKYYCQEGQEIEINVIIIRIFESWGEEESLNEMKAEKNDNVEKVIFSEAAISLIAKYNLSKHNFSHLDFVSSSDVLKSLKIQTEKTESPEIENINIINDHITLERLPKHKRTEIAYLKDVQSSGLISTVNMYVDTSHIFESINPYLKYFKNSLLPVVLYETSRLLIKYPVFNAFYTNNSIAYYKTVNCGIAIDIMYGLKTVNIQDTNKKQISEIEEKILELSNKYIDNNLNLGDLSNITFTITDLSAEGTAFFTPLINQSNSAILAISAYDPLLNRTLLSLSFDHRLTEGRQASIFLRELKERLESYKLTRNIDVKIADIKCFKCLKDISEDHNGVGFLKTILADGTENYICQTCFNGF